MHDASDPDDDDHAGAARDRLVRSVLRHIDRHLGDPDLGPESIAAAHRISVRYLHRLFEDEAVTVSRLRAAAPRRGMREGTGPPGERQRDRLCCVLALGVPQPGALQPGLQGPVRSPARPVARCRTGDDRHRPALNHEQRAA